MERKSDKVRRLVADGEYRKALSIARRFRMGVTKEQSVSMNRGYECMINPLFYASIGFDTDLEIENGIKVVTELYGGK